MQLLGFAVCPIRSYLPKPHIDHTTVQSTEHIHYPRVLSGWRPRQLHRETRPRGYPSIHTLAWSTPSTLPSSTWTLRVSSNFFLFLVPPMRMTSLFETFLVAPSPPSCNQGAVGNIRLFSPTLPSRSLDFPPSNQILSSYLVSISSKLQPSCLPHGAGIEADGG